MSKPAYTIALDKLELLISEAENHQNESICLNSKGSVSFMDDYSHRNPSFSKAYRVYIDSNCVAVLFAEYNGKYRYNANSPMLLSLNNSVFYTLSVNYAIKTIIDSIGGVFIKNIHAIHIAIDGYNFVSIHQKLLNSKVYKRQIAFKYIALMVTPDNKNHLSQTIGSRKSDKYVVVYNKQEEIQNSNKQYIQDFWERNNLPCINDYYINRIEGRLNAKALKTISPNEADFDNSEFLISVFRNNFERYLSFRHIKKNTKKHLINWSFFNVDYIKSTIQKVNPDSDFALRVTLKFLFTEFIVTGLEDIFLAFLTLVKRYDKSDYVLNNAPKWKKPFT